MFPTLRGGLAAGSIVSIAAGRLTASLLFGTELTDALTCAGMVVLLLAVALAAGCLPPWRASHIGPMMALRST